MKVYLLSRTHRDGLDQRIFAKRSDAVEAALDTMNTRRKDFVASVNLSRNSLRHLVTAFDVLIRERNLQGASDLWLDVLREPISIESFDVVPPSTQKKRS